MEEYESPGAKADPRVEESPDESPLREPQDESQNDAQDESQVEHRDIQQDESEEELQSNQQDESDDESQSDPQDESEDESETEPQDKLKEKSQDKPQDEPEDEPQDEPQDGQVSDNSDSEDSEREQEPKKVYDFDLMMARKKEESSRKRKKRNYDIINDNDDIIADIVNQMKDAAEADAEANRNRQAAIQKLKLLPFVMSQLRKIELRDSFLDSDVLRVMTEWLAPLPDKSLPHLQVRESILKTLVDLNLYDVDRIKGSGIGKAVMYLYKHPKETKENKQRAKHLISCWSRPIFQLDSSFNSISREEREQRDLELMSKQRRTSRTSDGAGPSNTTPKRLKDDNAQKPGDKGWIPRARVPAPSMRDYVIRPRSKVDGDIGKSSKRPSNMLEKYMKSQQERRRAGRQQRAINMNIDRG